MYAAFKFRYQLSENMEFSVMPIISLIDTESIYISQQFLFEFCKLLQINVETIL